MNDYKKKKTELIHELNQLRQERNQLKHRDDFSHLPEFARLARLAIDRAPEIILWLNAEGDILYANERATEMLGYTQASFLKMTVFDLYRDLTFEQWQQRWLESDDDMLALDSYFKTKDGAVLPVAERLSRCTSDTSDTSDDEEYIYLFARHSIERGQFEAELNRITEENKRLITAINDAGIGVSMSDPTLPDNPLTFINPAFTKITGYSAEEAIGKNCRFLQGPDTSAEAVAEIRNAIDKQRPSTVVLRNYRKDGTPFWNQLTIDPVFDDSGRLINFIGFQVDVTKHKEAEEALSKRVSELKIVAEVGTAVSTILETNKLLQEIVDTTKDRFQLYHAHIYLLNRMGDTLYLAAGAGDIGRQLLAQNWQISLADPNSLVAQAARSRENVMVNDVTRSPQFLPNALLPNTRSELAVPMISGSHLLGVLDVQSDRLNNFSEEDAQVKTILATQIAVALQNARLFEQSKRQAEKERLVNNITQKIQNTVTVERALKVTIQELGQALKARSTRVQLTPSTSTNEIKNNN